MIQFPESIEERESYILQCVKDGNYQIEWVPIVSVVGQHKAKFWVSSDALKIDGIRVNVSAHLEQQIADIVGASLLTAKLADLIFDQAQIRITPITRSITASTKIMVEQSQAIDNLLSKQSNYTGHELVSTVGKHWCIDQILSQKPNRAVNYGWHFTGNDFHGIKGEVCASLTKDPITGMYYRVIQGRGTAHDMHHVDYSQNCVLVLNACVVNDNEEKLQNILKSKELAELASHQGVMSVFRQPGVPQLETNIVVLPETTIYGDDK
jgi:hypothetical protein